MMILILLAIVIFIGASFYITKLNIPNWGEGLETIGIVGVVAGLLMLVAYCSLTFNYIAAGYKKDIINREYKTTYTQQEIFYAHDVIDTIAQLQRKRIEINGDLLKDKK